MVDDRRGRAGRRYQRRARAADAELRGAAEDTGDHCRHGADRRDRLRAERVAPAVREVSVQVALGGYAMKPETLPAVDEKAKVDVAISHSYGGLSVHDDVRFTVRENEFLCIGGPSGCGKTT